MSNLKIKESYKNICNWEYLNVQSSHSLSAPESIATSREITLFREAYKEMLLIHEDMSVVNFIKL